MDSNYFRLGQLYTLLDKKGSVNDLKTFLKKSNYDLNYQIPDDSSAYNGYTVLHFSANFRRQDFIKFLLSCGADFTLKASNGFTPLRTAVETKTYSKRKKLSTLINDIPEINLLLSAHVESNNTTNPTCNDGISHFHIACLADNVQVAKLFLQSGVSANEKVNETSDLFPGWTPLHFAVRYGNEELVKLLFAHGAYLNQMDGNGLTPLRLLVERSIEINNRELLGRQIYQFNEVEKELLRNDTLIDLFVNKIGYEYKPDDIGLSMFHVSCTKRDTTLVKQFLKLDNVDVNSKVKSDSIMWPAYTPLHFAACCNPRIFNLLLENGADIFAKDVKGVTPFDLFIQRYKPTDVSDMFKAHPILRRIQFEDGAMLFDAISSMEKKKFFDRFISKMNVNTRLPESSPLWPGYTLSHLYVALSRVTYKFHHNCLIRKNDLINKNYEERIVDNDFISRRLYFEENLTIQDANGMTPLHLAFYTKNEKIVDQIVREMLSSSIVKNCVDRKGLSHLQIACIVNNVELVSKFLECGSDPHSTIQSDVKWKSLYGSIETYKTGFTLYQIAETNYSRRMIEAITRVVSDAGGLNTIQSGFLSHNNHESTLEMLLSLSTTEKINYIAKNAGRLSYLHTIHKACLDDDFVSVKKLLNIGIDVKNLIDCKTTSDSLYADWPSRYIGWAPLHFAVHHSSIEAVDFLISKGADCRAKTDDDLNSLHLALESFIEMDLVKRLYSEFKVAGDWCDDFGLTKLHVACITEDEIEIECLLKAGEDVNSQINANSPIRPGDTALHILISLLSNEIDVKQKIKILLKHGADLTLKNYYNETPLHKLYQLMPPEDYEFVIDLLTKADSHFYEVNPRNDNGLSHFHICCIMGNLNIIQNFIVFGVDINEYVQLFSLDNDFTLLHFVIDKGENKKEVIQVLLRHGANLKLENSRGLTPIQHAMNNNPNMPLDIFSDDQISKNIQVENIFGKTALGILLKKNVTKSNFLMYSKIGINFIDPPSKKEDIAKAIWILDNDVFRTLVESASDVTNIDSDGKNVIHSIGLFANARDPLKEREKKGNWNKNKNKKQKAYDDRIKKRFFHCALNVNLLLDRGCNLNLKDKRGRTPLHDAAIAESDAVNVLLILGADVNIRDNEGHTAYSYIKNNDTKRLFLDHVSLLFGSGLYLDDSLSDVIRNNYHYGESYARYKCDRYLTRMADVSITEDLPLRDLFKEKVISNFPHFPISKRKMILEFLRPERLFENYEEWGDWNNLFLIQYRKILRRIKLLELANTHFYNRIYDLDSLCVDLILHKLSNNDLESLIKV